MPNEIISPRRLSSAMDGMQLTSDEAAALANNPQMLRQIGIGLPSRSSVQLAMDSINAAAMDSITNPVTSAAVGTPAQFLQEFLPGVVHVLTRARVGDMLAPMVAAGQWHDEEVVQRVLEHLGKPEAYKDHGDLPVTSWNQTYDRRTIVRFEMGVAVHLLEEARAAAASVNDAVEKRAAATEALEIQRNHVFFNGYNDGTNRTYGFLNDPNLPSYVTVDTGTGGDTTWASKSVNERISDLLTAFSAIRSQSGSRIDPQRDKLILAMASDVVDSLNDLDTLGGAGDYGITVRKWLTENYPNVTVEPVPELNEADSGENAFYVYAERVMDSGTDGGNAIVQVCPTKLQALNSVKTVKGFKEGYTNATAGCYVKRGFACVRYSGL